LLLDQTWWRSNVAGGLSLFPLLALVASALMYAWQIRLIQSRAPGDYFKAFISNSWVGLAIFRGFVLHFM